MTKRIDIDQGSDLLGMLAIEMGQKTRQMEMPVALADLGLQNVLVQHDKIAQTIHHVVEHVRETLH